MKKICLKSNIFGYGLLLLLFLLAGWSLKTNKANATIEENDIELYYSGDFGNVEGYEGLEEYNHQGTSTARLVKLEQNGATAEITTGKFGNAFHFPDNSGNSTPQACYYTEEFSATSTEFAYSFWYKSNTTNGQGQAIANRDRGQGGIVLRNNSTSGLFTYKSGGNYIDYNLDNLFVRDNDWHQVVIQGTYGQLANSDAKVYLDGQVLYTGFGANNSLDTSGVPNNFAIGGGGIGGSLPCFYTYQGYIDDVAFLNRKLTETEIAELQTKSVYEILQTPTYYNTNIIYPQLTYSGQLKTEDKLYSRFIITTT